ncbi:MAG TPA: HEAT repeat domain-containing protein, partial [Planctomycetota bacterium]|nr:HEAT repeat domain-containing protein [Planctomycetota bacterium]
MREAFASIARLEAGRHTGGGYLQTLVRHSDPAVRERAARALGRMPIDVYGRNVTGPLEVALKDPSGRVRRVAAFALGQRNDASAVEALIAAAGDEDPDVRGQIWMALGRLGTPPARAAQRAGLQDPSPVAQAAAAQAIFYWPKDVPDAEWSAAANELLEVVQNASPTARWHALFAWARRTELRGDLRGFQAALAREDAGEEERLFATMGLARAALAESTADGVDPNPAGEPDPMRVALERCAMDEDYRVVVEALRGLQGAEIDGKRVFRGRPATLSTPLAQTLMAHPSAHVRAAAVMALGDDYAGPEPGQLLARDPSSMVRRAAFEAHIRRHPADAVARVREWGRSRDYRQRRTAVLSARWLDSDEGRGIVYGLTQDKHPQVAEEAIDQLQFYPGEETRTRLYRFCGDEDNGRSLAAISALGALPLTSKDLPALIEAYEAAHGDGSVEVCFGAIRAAAKIEDDSVVEFLKAGLLHEDPYVEQVAREALTARGIAIDPDQGDQPRADDRLEPAPVWPGDLPNP